MNEVPDRVNSNNAVVKVFNGYGHQQNLVVYGHVSYGKKKKEKAYTFSVLRNMFSIAKLYFIRPVPAARVRMQWNEQSIFATADDEGFFQLEWTSVESTPAGWKSVKVYLLDRSGNDTVFGEGNVFIPHITQYAFISDIDDTVLVSHSASTGKKLTTLFTIDPLKRKTFSDVVRFYQLLASSHTEATVPNPFFYVSNSEWNLYDYLAEFFKQNKLPDGSFLLSDFKRWTELFKRDKHRGKGPRMQRILEVFPNQRFVLIGDNSQQDPVIYSEIANRHPNRIEAIYMRVINIKKKAATVSILASIQNKNIRIFLFEDTSEAIEHATNTGLLRK